MSELFQVYRKAIVPKHKFYILSNKKEKKLRINAYTIESTQVVSRYIMTNL